MRCWALLGVVLPLASWAAPVRDVLATAFDAPLLTDADLLDRPSDTVARLRVSKGPVLVRYRGLGRVLVDGQPAAATRLSADLLAVAMTPGDHAILVERGSGEAATASPRVAGAVTPQGFAAALEAAAPGGEVVLRDGVYTDLKLAIKRSGTAAAPLHVRPETPGGVMLRRNSAITIQADFVVLSGFRFDQCGPGTVVNIAPGNDNRVTQCQFTGCGNPVSTFQHIVEIGSNSSRNRVDFCTFTGSKSMSLAQRVSTTGPVGTDNRFDHNLFRDIYRYWVNGQENIQLGQNQRGDSGRLGPRCVVEHNVFDHAWGDSEIFSNKSSDNVIRYNLAAHCPRSAYTLRGGHRVRVEGNVAVNCDVGLRICGSQHVVANNLFLNTAREGITIETGTTQDGATYEAATDVLVAHNTVLNTGGAAIAAMRPAPGRDLLPRRVTIRNNLVSAAVGEAIVAATIEEGQVDHNLVLPPATGDELVSPSLAADLLGLAPPPGVARGGVALAAVTLDRLGRPRPRDVAPDLGADQLEAPGRRPEPRAIPAEPFLAPDLFRGEPLLTWQTEQPAAGWPGAATDAATQSLALRDGTLTMDRELPEDLLLEWEYWPASWAAKAAIDLPGGYRLAWGGLAGDKLPAGVMTLSRTATGEVLADAADLCCYYQNFRYQGWMGRTLETGSGPDARRWYQFTLLRQGARLILLLGQSNSRSTMPVMVWEDSAPTGGAAPLRLRQEGEGKWRAFRAWRAAYAADRVPPAPADLAATAPSGYRVALRWTAAPGAAYEVLRRADGAPETLLVAAVRAGRFDDCAVQPGQSYRYVVRSTNVLGERGAAAEAAVRMPADGAWFTSLPATAARCEPPLVARRDRELGLVSLGAPTGAASASGAPPLEGLAELRFTAPRAGDYAVWGWVLGPSDAMNSWWWSTPAVAGGEWAIWHHTPRPDWHWERLTAKLPCPAGETVIRLKHREPGTKLLHLVVSADLAWDPTTP